MNFDYYAKHFRAKALKAGYSEDEVLKCLDYAKPLIELDIPVIYNTANLAALVGYKKNYLKRAALFTRFFYRSFQIKKASGKTRTISEPLPSLKEIQIWILHEILHKIPVSRFAKAYVRNRSILDNVRFHKKKAKVVCIDIKDFFGSITRNAVEKIFLDFGYSSNVSNLLGKLCCCDDVLPQGAPTSPYLSNIFLRDFDEALAIFCKSIDVRFTRYADDLTFSGDFDEFELIAFVNNELKSLNLSANSEKLKIMQPNQRQVVTGIVLNKKTQIPKDQRKLIRQEVHYLEKFGLIEHLNHTKNNRANYIGHLLGKINYALYINPKDKEMKKYRSFINENYNTNL